MKRSYLDLEIKTFLGQSEFEILGHLSNAHRFDLELNQKRAWRYQIQHLHQHLNSFENGRIFFEFSIPRMGKRADVILLIQNIIFILEYKIGSSQIDKSGLDQVHDYALDLKNFHIGSHDRNIVPILIPTDLRQTTFSTKFAKDNVSNPIAISPEILTDLIKGITYKYGNVEDDSKFWASSGYRPTPTIVEAAQALFAGHSVREITRSESGAINLEKTSMRVLDAIKDAKKNNRKSLIFITGVPGSGKTLAGLEIATASRRESNSENEGVFLTGNGPLANVLREALANDEVKRNNISKTEAKRKSKTFIQNIHHFRDEYLEDTTPPFEKVVVYDEAQRAWNQEETSKFMAQKRGLTNFGQSEPEFLLSVMARHENWCAVICLIGNGQEINSGESGVVEWVKAAESSKENWNIHFSKQLFQYEQDNTPEIFNNLNSKIVNICSDYHLATSVRSFRSESLSKYIGYVLEGNIKHANSIMDDLKNYPLYITRSIVTAKDWLMNISRGSERFGFVASSNAIRLKPYGLNVKSKVDPVHWFLSPKEDIRSSYYLEDLASEFEIQGLELDWIGLCWDANLRKNGNHWDFFKFSGTKWQNIVLQNRKNYLLNSYRVLMTRARQGMIIFIPPGDTLDKTREPEFYDPTFEYLLSCGFEYLP